MGSLLFFSTVLILLLVGYYVNTSFILALFALLILPVVLFASKFLLFYAKEAIWSDGQAPLVGSVFTLLIHFNKLYDYETSVARSHRTFRLVKPPSQSEIFTADPQNVEYILKTNFPNYGRGAYNYDIMRDLFGDGIFAVDGDKWRHQRKLASLELSTKVLRDFSTSTFQASAGKLVSEVTVKARNSLSIDLQDLLMKSTLDSMFEVGFGVELNSVSGTDNFANKFTKAFDDANRIVFWRFVDPLWKIRRILNVGSEASLKKNIKAIDDFVFNLIQCKNEQMESGKLVGRQEDILSRFLMERKKDPDNMSDRYLRDITLNFVIAGKDTSASTLTWFFYMLCKHPLIQERIVNEVREAIGAHEGTTAPEFSKLVTEEAVDKMQYLHAALTETLRLYPAVASNGKCAVRDDVLPDGFKVRKGDGITYMPYAMGRMRYIWGDDAEEFLPERWLDKGVFQPESPYKFIAFQAGPRICLGKEFAYRQMKILSAVLLHFLRFKLVDETKEATYRTMFTLHMGYMFMHSLGCETQLCTILIVACVMYMLCPNAKMWLRAK